MIHLPIGFRRDQQESEQVFTPAMNKARNKPMMSMSARPTARLIIRPYARPSTKPVRIPVPRMKPATVQRNETSPDDLFCAACTTTYRLLYRLTMIAAPRYQIRLSPCGPPATQMIRPLTDP